METITKETFNKVLVPSGDGQIGNYGSDGFADTLKMLNEIMKQLNQALNTGYSLKKTGMDLAGGDKSDTPTGSVSREQPIGETIKNYKMEIEINEDGIADVICGFIKGIDNLDDDWKAKTLPDIKKLYDDDPQKIKENIKAFLTLKSDQIKSYVKMKKVPI